MIFGKQQMSVPTLALVAACLLGFYTSSIMAQSPSQVEDLSSTCLSELDDMWALYTAPTTWTDACDPQCLLNCNEVLQDAVYSSTSKDCPDQTNITTCFNIYAVEWQKYVGDCELFDFTEDPCSGGEGEGCPSAEGEAASETTSAEGEASAPGAAPEAEGEAASEAAAPSSEDTGDAAGEGEAAAATDSTTSAAGEGEATPTPVAEDSSDGEASSDTTPTSTSSSDSASEGEGSRRRLLAAEGEAASSESAGSGQGCFPVFKTKADFTVYMSGQYFNSSLYTKDSNTAGVIMSVFFWLGMASVGVLVRK